MIILSKAERKALAILREHARQHRERTPGRGYRGMSATEFALKMWPDSPGWSHVSNCGTHGARHGCGMWRAAGSWLSKLASKGLARRARQGYALGADGFWALRESEGDSA